jgi:hypothetical protein
MRALIIMDNPGKEHYHQRIPPLSNQNPIDNTKEYLLSLL